MYFQMLVDPYAAESVMGETVTVSETPGTETETGT
jgi:hypothetical protein